MLKNLDAKILNRKVFFKFLLSASIAFSGAGISTTNAQETFSLQQVTNYVINGHPEIKRNMLFGIVAHVFDKQQCVSGAQFDDGGYIKIHWNNVDRHSMRVFSTYFDAMGDDWYTLEFSGIKPVVESKLKNALFSLGWIGWGNSGGLASSATFPIGSTSIVRKDHLVDSIKYLYSEHCVGSDEESQRITVDSVQSSVRSFTGDFFGGLSNMIRMGGQVYQLNSLVEQVLTLIEQDDLTRAKFKAMSIKWVPTGEESVDGDQSAHFEEIRSELLKLIEESE